MKTLPPFLQQLLDSPPRAGAGVHSWLFRTARHLHAHMPAPEIVTLLEQRAAHCGRHVPKREITAAVADALECAWTPNGTATSSPPPERRWPELDNSRRAELLKNASGLADLWETSPVRIEAEQSVAEEIIDQIFPGDPLLCCGSSSSSFNTRTREEWRGMAGKLSLIVPSPMSAITGTTKDGRTSKHTLSNTGARRFLVCEFDHGTTDDHARLLLHLATKAPLTLAVFSGSKSLHGWFFVAGEPEEKILRFFRYAVSLGADPATWTRSQFVRMPDGRRENGARQTAFFFNPSTIQN